jgi:hypothetical protein
MYDFLNLFGKSKYGSTFVLSRISCIASGLALLKNEQKFMHGGCVGAHKTPISKVQIFTQQVLCSTWCFTIQAVWVHHTKRMEQLPTTA